jgi:hypothetical protein
MLPFLDDTGFAYGAAEMKVVTTNCSHLFTVEAWFAVFNGCGELTNTHVYGQNLGILPFQVCLFLNGYVHVPFSVFSTKKVAFPHLKRQ